MRSQTSGRIILGLVFIAVLGFVLFNQDGGENNQTVISSTTVETADPPTTASETSTTVGEVAVSPPPDTTEAPARTTSTAPSSTTTTTAIDSPTVTTEPATTTTTSTTSTTVPAAVAGDPDYITALGDVRQTLTGLAEKMAEANLLFDNRDPDGPDFKTTLDSLSGEVEVARYLVTLVSEAEVPEPLAESHPEAIEQANLLLTRSEEVLAALRLPYPEDGSVRREKLADFNEASEAFTLFLGNQIQNIEDNAEELGLASPDPDSGELDWDPEAVLYLEWMQDITEKVGDFHTDLNQINQAWDQQRELGVTYRQLEASLIEILGDTRSLEVTVQNLSTPSELSDLHQGSGGLNELAGQLVEAAEQALAGLRLPSPDDGTQRRNSAAEYATTSAELLSVLDQLLDP